MGVDPIDEFASLHEQQQIAKLFRFGNVEEISLYEHSVAINKSKSLRDNSTNQRLNHQKDRKQLKRIRKDLKVLKCQLKDINVKKKKGKKRNKSIAIQKKRIQKQIKKKTLLDINWHEFVPLDLKNDIKNHLIDLKKRKSMKVANEMKILFEEYQDRIGKEKFDIGRIDGVQYKIRMKPGVKPYSRQPHDLAPEHEEEVKKTVETLLKHGLIEQ